MLVIGQWHFDPASRRLLAGQDERRLSPKAAEVLVALAEKPHLVWSRDALLERVWPNVTVGEEVLTHAVAELRRTLGDDFRDPAYVETVHKRGYRLKCLVEQPLGPPEQGSGDGAPSCDLQLYTSYLEACDLFERGGTLNTVQAASQFASLAQAAPNFAPAHVGTAKSLAFLALFYSAGSVDLERALGHCESARRSDPHSAEAMAVKGFIHTISGHYSSALQHFRAAVRLAPGSSDVHYLLGRASFAELDLALAAPMLERAAALRNDDYHSLMLAGKARLLGGDDARARSNFVQASARVAPRLEAYPDDAVALCGLARCLVYLGRPDEASSLLGRVRDYSDPTTFYLACTFARAGETRRALDTLEQMVEHGWNRRSWLDRDPDLDGLRQDRRFVRIAESISRN